MNQARPVPGCGIVRDTVENLCGLCVDRCGGGSSPVKTTFRAGAANQRLLASLPPDLHPVARPERGAKESHQMGGGSTVRQQIDCRQVNVVVLVFRRLFFKTVDKNLEIGLGDAADELIR